MRRVLASLVALASSVFHRGSTEKAMPAPPKFQIHGGPVPTKSAHRKPASRGTRAGRPAFYHKPTPVEQRRNERKAEKHRVRRELGLSMRAMRKLRRAKTDEALQIVLQRWKAAGRFPLAVKELGMIETQAKGLSPFVEPVTV